MKEQSYLHNASRQQIRLSKVPCSSPRPPQLHIRIENHQCLRGIWEAHPKKHSGLSEPYENLGVRQYYHYRGHPSFVEEYLRGLSHDLEELG